MTPPRWEFFRAAGFCAVREQKRTGRFKNVRFCFLRLAIGSRDQA
jgi:hypothetical protein